MKLLQNLLLKHHLSKRSLDSLAKVVLGNRIALDYLLAEQGSICAVANAACCTWINAPGMVETWLHRITEQAIWLEGVTAYCIWIGLVPGDHSSELHSKHWELSCL